MHWQVEETRERAVIPKKTPEEFAEDMFEYMEVYPPAPLDAVLTQAQLAELREAFLPRAAARMQWMVDGTDIIRPYTMQWAVGVKEAPGAESWWRF